MEEIREEIVKLHNQTEALYELITNLRNFAIGVEKNMKMNFKNVFKNIRYFDRRFNEIDNEEADIEDN
jgi:hypothetical protein